MRLKKTPTRIGGHEYIIESAQINADRFQMTESFIRRQAEKEDGLSITQCLHIYIYAGHAVLALFSQKQWLFCI